MGLWGRVKKAAKKLGQGVERIGQYGWHRAGEVWGDLGFEPLLEGTRNILKGPDIDIDIPEDPPLPPASKEEEGAEIVIGSRRKKRNKSGASAFRIDRTSAVASSIGVNVPI